MSSPDPARLWTAGTASLCIAFLALHAVVLARLAWVVPCTSDEFSYLGGGAAILRTWTWDTPDTYKHGPLFYYVTQLPAQLGCSTSDFTSRLAWSRLGSALASVLVGLFLADLGRRVFGARLAVFAVVLYATNPLVLGHGCLVTSDITLTCAWIACTWSVYLYLAKPTWPRFCALAVLVGASQATKHTAILLAAVLLTAVPILPLLGFWPRALFSRRSNTLARCWLDLVLLAVVGGAIALLTLHALYLFAPGCWSPSEHTACDSGFVTRARAAAPAFEYLLRLLPHPFVEGLDYQTDAVARYFSFAFGEVGRGHWAYYLASFGTKLPLAVLALLALAPFFARRIDNRPFCALLWLSTLVPLAYMSFFTSFGVRFQLQIVPVLCMVAAVPLSVFWKRTLAARTVAVFLLLWAVVSVASSWPHYVGYFNQLFRERPYLVFGDSNLDWHADPLAHPDEAVLLARHPRAERVFFESGPRFGTVLAYGLDFWPIRQPRLGPVQHWLRRFEPIDRQGAWFAFEVGPSDFRRFLGAEDPRAAGDLAVALLGSGAHREAGGVLTTVQDERRPLLARQLELVRERSSDVAGLNAGWRALGRHDRILADARSDPVQRASALFARQEWDRCIAVLEEVRSRQELALDQSGMLALSYFNRFRFDEALAVVDRHRPEPGHPVRPRFDDLERTILGLQRHMETLGIGLDRAR